MKICILLPVVGEENEELRGLDVPYDPSPHLVGHTWEKHQIFKRTSHSQIAKLLHKDFDIFLNLCDGLADEDCAGIEVTQQLHDAGIAYTGARPDFYDPTRQQMKKACRARGLLTPPYAFISNLEDARRAARSLQFPLIVKPAQGYGSIGIRRTSRVMNEIALLDEVARQLELFDSALIEEFIDGREFTVLVAENPVSATWPLVYQPVEIFFPPGETFKHFDLKWRAFRGMRTVPCQDPQLAGLLMDISRSFFLEMGGSGYARCDIRLDTAGAAYLLEINPNCGIFYPPDNPGSADYILMNDPAGHCGFIETIFRVAEQRRKLPA